ncbi:hypothetical protein OAK89_04570 [Akkermansiaceae bacterium]|nr:hypothetical protein [Akkermansiaceae bacterium]
MERQGSSLVIISTMLRIILLLGLISQLATAAPRATDEILVS